jgi:hypothetical protein
MPGPVIAVGLALLAALAVAAWLVPAPQVSDDAWTCARIGLVPVGLLWLVSLTFFSRPVAFAFAMTSGAGFWAVLWVLRSPPQIAEGPGDGDEPGGGGGGGGPGGGDDGPHGPSPGDSGEQWDWDVFERVAFDAWRDATRTAGAGRVPD